MFPEDIIDAIKIGIESDESANECPIGRSFEYDYGRREYVVPDGKIKEIKETAAVRQWIELMLRTPDGRYAIYNGTEFGVDLDKYTGYKKSNLGFVQSELRREISEKIVQNRAVLGIENFEVVDDDNRMAVNFTAILRSGEKIIIDKIV